MHQWPPAGHTIGQIGLKCDGICAFVHRFLPVTALNIKSTMIAPITDMISPLVRSCVISCDVNRLARKPPAKDPTTPKTIVAKQPIESSPGTRARAIRPTIPTIIRNTTIENMGSFLTAGGDGRQPRKQRPFWLRCERHHREEHARYKRANAAHGRCYRIQPDAGTPVLHEGAATVSPKE